MSGVHQGRVLTPKQAVNIAKAVYQILRTDHIAKSYFPSSIWESFDIAGATTFDGKSGPTLKPITTGFGIVAMGKQNKRMSSGQDFSHDALIAIRGTQKWFDWVTDFHAGAQFIDGKLVHSGFFKVFRSILTPINQFFHQHKPQRVHVVGHSLGGAVAVLVSNWIQKHTSAEPILYTFGAPRVGGGPFAKHFTAKIKPQNIYRVYHANDPVPMVPVWPFVHTPDPGRDYCVHYFGSHYPINLEAHRIDTYRASVHGHATWGSFPHKVKTAPSDAEIRRWIVSNHTNSNISWRKEYSYLGHAILYIQRQRASLSLDREELRIMKHSDDMDILAMAAKKHNSAATKAYAEKASEELKKLQEQLNKKIQNTLALSNDLQKKLPIDPLQYLLPQLVAQMKGKLYELAWAAVKYETASP